MIDLKKFKKPEIYKDKNLFINVLWYLINNLFFNSFIPGSKLRIIILNMFGADINKSAYIKPRVYIKFPWKLKIGKYSWIGEKVWIDNIDHVEIGNNCCISQGVYFCTGNHDFKKETFDLKSEKILIEDSVWVGAMTIICPGSYIKSNQFIKTGSVFKNKN